MQHKETLKNRILAMVLTTVMLFSNLQISVSAAEETAGEEITSSVEYSMPISMEGLSAPAEDASQEENIAVSLPEQSFSDVKGGIFVTIFAPEGALPENTKMVVTSVEEEEILDAVEEAVDGEVARLRAVDITFFDADGLVVEPLRPVEVTLRAYGMGQMEDLQVVHIDDEGTGQVVEDVNNEGIAAQFETDEFSVYAIVEILERIIEASDNRTYKITVEYGAASGIPAGAELKVEEVDEKDYAAYLTEAAETLDVDIHSVAYGRLFDISIVKDGVEYQPNEDVTVKVELLDVEKVDDVKVVHFEETEDDIIKGEALKATTDDTTVTFETDGFSVFSFMDFSLIDQIVNAVLGSQTGTLYENDDIILSGSMPSLGVVEAERVDMSVGDQEALLAYDIKIYANSIMKLLGINWQPSEGAIQVTVKSDALDVASVDVYHKEDSDDDEGALELVGEEITVENDSVTFDAASFSVYVIIDHEGNTVVTTPRVQFHFIDKDYTEDGGTYTAGPFNFYNRGTPNEYQCSQILTDGESLEMIANPPNITAEGSEKFFYGWYVVSVSDTPSVSYTYVSTDDLYRWTGSISYSWTEDPDKISFESPMVLTDASGNALTDSTVLTAASDGAEGTELKWTIDGVTYSGKLDSKGIIHVYLAPIYEDYYFVNFRMGGVNDNDSGLQTSLLTRKLAILGSDGSATVRIGDIICPSSDPTHKVFVGWQTRQMHENSDYYHTVDESGNETDSSEGSGGFYITLAEEDFTGTVYDLYPLFVEARWLSFNTGKSGNGSTYVESTYRLTNDERLGTYYDNAFFGSHTSIRNGYTNEGWYAFAKMNDDSEITNLETAQPVEVNFVDTDSQVHTVTFNIKAQQIVDGSNNQLVAPSDGTIATATVDGVNYTLKASGGIFYINYGGNDYKLFGVENNKLYFYRAMDDLTVSANWVKETETTYRVVIWKQKITDDVNTFKTPVDLALWLAEDASHKAEDYYTVKDYDYEIYYVTTNASTASTPDLSNFTGYYIDSNGNQNAVNRSLLNFDTNTPNYLTSFKGFRYSDNDARIVGSPAPDGSTVYNVYYDREIHRLTFQGSGSGYAYTVTTGSTTPQYAFINGEWVTLTRGDVIATDTEYFLTQTSGSSTEYTGTVYDSNGNTVSNPVYNNTYYRTRNTNWLGNFTSVANPLYWNSRTVNEYEWLVPEYGDVYTASDAYEAVMYGDINGNKVILTPVYGPVTTTTDVYKRTSTLTAGNDYLIVSRNSAGYGYALSHSGTTINTDSVTVNTGTTASNNVPFILASDVEETSVWTVSGSYKFQNGNYYLRRSNNNALQVSTTNSNNTWSWDSSNNRLSINNRYLRFYNNSFSLVSNSNSVYLYAKDINTETTTGITGYSYNGETYSGTRYTKSYGPTGNNVAYYGTRYTRTSVNSNPTVYVVEALYGQTISGFFPIPGYTNGERWKPGTNSQGWSQVMVVVDIMPDEDITFTVSTSTATELTMNYYIQALPDAVVEHSYSGVDYILYNTVPAKYSYITSEDFLDLTGFTKNGSYPTISGNTYLTNYNNTINFYYLRQSFDFTFDVNYPDAATVTFSNGRSNNLTLDPKVYYEASLSNYGFTATTDGNVTTTHWYYGIVGTENDVVNTADNTLIAPDHYIFGGWYEDATCTVPFNFDSTMPAANKIVYAKWTPEKFRIKIDPNGGEIDHVDHSSGGFSRLATYKSDGVTVERPADSGYNPSQSTYFNGTYGDLIGEYAVSRYYVPISNAAAASYTGNIYYYMNHQYTELDGNGINAIYRNALYLTDEEVHAYYTYYSQNGVTNLDEDIWRQLYVSTQKYRYVADGEVYKFLGWYQVFDEGTSNEHLGDMPYVFTTPISGPVTLRAVWRLDGGYTIRYHADYYMDDGTYINGTMPDNAWTDPMAGSAVLSYADGANTNIYKQPTNIMVNGNESDEYIFRGYILVNVTSSVNDQGVTVYRYEPLEVDQQGNVTTYYQPGDAYTVLAANADTNRVIHLEAVYQERDSSYRRPEVTNLTLDANGGYLTTGTGYVNGTWQTGTKLTENMDLTHTSGWDGVGTVAATAFDPETGVTLNPDALIEFGDIQSNQEIHLYRYATGLSSVGGLGETALTPAGTNYFSHEKGYFLLGFDNIKNEGDYIADYAADSIIAIDRKQSQTIYAVWEPMIYLNFENNMDKTINFSLSPTSTSSLVLYVLNQVTGLYDRQEIDPSNLSLAAGEKIQLALPYGEEQELLISGTNELGVGKILTWDTSITDDDTEVTYTSQDGTDSENVLYNQPTYEHSYNGANCSHDLAKGSVDSSGNATFSFREKLLFNKKGLTVIFDDKDIGYALVLKDNYNGDGTGGGTQEFDYASVSSEDSELLPSTSTRMGYQLQGWAYSPNAETPNFSANLPSIENAWTITNLEDFFAPGSPVEKEYINNGSTLQATLYAVWTINKAASTVYVYKEVPEPGNKKTEFEFVYSLTGTYRNSNETQTQSINKTQTFKLAHGDYAVLVSTNSTTEGTIGTIITIYEANGTIKKDSSNNEMVYPVQWSPSTVYNSGSFQNLNISVTETPVPYYETEVTRSAQSTNNYYLYVGDDNGGSVTQDDTNKVHWIATDAGGTLVFTNQRQTYNVTLEKVLHSNTTVPGTFPFIASYTVDGVATILPNSQVTSGTPNETWLANLPAGAELTIIEANNGNYTTKYKVGEGTFTDASVVSDSGNQTGVKTNSITVDANKTVTFDNTLKSYPVKFRLFDQEGTPLSGMFSMSSSTGSLGNQMYANPSNGGVFYQSGAFYVGDYTLNETIIQTGYIGLTDPAAITVTGTGISTDSDMIYIMDDPDVEGGYIITVYNIVPSVDITLTKKLDDPLLEQRTFNFTVGYTYVLRDSVTDEEMLTIKKSETYPIHANAAGISETIQVPGGATVTASEVLTTALSSTYDTTYAVNGGTEQTGSSWSETIGNEDMTVVFTNTRKTQKVTVSKTLDDAEASGAVDFKFTALLQYNNAGVASYTLNNAESVVTADGTNDTTAGLAEFTLSPTASTPDSVELMVPYGTKLTIAEDTSQTIGGTSKTVAEVYDTTYSLNGETAVSGSSHVFSSVTADQTLAFTNRRKGADLTVTKTVTGDMGDTSSTNTFTFTLMVDGAETGTQYTYTGTNSGTLTLNESGQATFPLAHNQNITIQGLPLNTTITVTEAHGDYTMSVPATKPDNMTDYSITQDSGTTTTNGVSFKLSGDATLPVENNLPAVAPTDYHSNTKPFIIFLLTGLFLSASLFLDRHRRKKGKSISTSLMKH